MARRSHGGLIRAEVEVKFPENFDFSLLHGHVETHIDQIANEIANEARASTAFSDFTGRLRKSIKKLKRKDKDGEPITVVAATAPHAHLVEFGTQAPRASTTGKWMPLRGIPGQGGNPKFAKVVGPMPACPFLRPAMEKVIGRIVSSLTGVSGG